MVRSFDQVKPEKPNEDSEVGVNQKNIELRYSLSDVCLFRVSFQASLQPLPFDPQAEAHNVPPSPPDLPPATDVVVRSGLIISRPMAPLHRFKNGICYVRNQTPNYYIDMSGGFDDYLKGFSSKTRSTLSRKVRKVSGTMQVRCFRTASEALEFHTLAREVAVKTYQEKLFDGAIPASGDFVKKMCMLAEQDCFRGFTLMAEGKPVSYLYLPVENNVLIYGYLGYDPAFAELSVGTVLLYLAIEQLFAERRFRYFDFTYGESQTKQLFGRGQFLRADAYFFRSNMRNRLAVYGHLFLDRFSEAIGRSLDALQLRSRVRKLLRRS